MSSIGRALERRVASYLKRRGVLPGARILVAFSGGPDSRALLEILVRLAASYPLKLSAGYLDHGLRPERERADEGVFVARCCHRLGVPLVRDALPPGTVAALGAREHRSPEEAARIVRYRFLRRALDGTGSAYMALGHTLDDHAETLAMRFFQGAGISGLRGIRSSRRRILRPLRDTSRAEIEGWLQEQGLEYRDDSTNRDPAYLRNAVRHRLLPLAEELFPGYRGALLRLSRTMEGLSSFVRSESRRRLRWRPEPGGASIDSQAFFGQPFVLRLDSLYRLIDCWGPKYRRVPLRFFEVLRDGDTLGRRQVLAAGHGLVLRRRGARLFLGRDVVGGEKKGYFVLVTRGSSVQVPEVGLVFRIGSGCTPEKPAFVFRSAQAGDCLHGRGGLKPVRKVFSEWKIPYSERWKVPVVDSRNGILAVLGKTIGYRNRYRHELAESVRAVLERAVEVC